MKDLCKFALGCLFLGFVLWIVGWGCDYMDHHTPVEAVNSIQQAVNHESK